VSVSNTVGEIAVTPKKLVFDDKENQGGRPRQQKPPLKETGALEPLSVSKTALSVCQDENLPNDSDSHYSDQALEAFLNGTDCKIDDEELLGLKKHLTVKQLPLTLLNSLHAKWKSGGGAHMDSGVCFQSKEEESNQTVWSWRFTLKSP